MVPSIWLLSADIMSQLGGGFRQQRWCEYILERGQPMRLFAVSGLHVRWADIHSVEELHAKRVEWIAASPPKAGVRDSRSARIGRFIKHTFMADLFLPSTFRLITTMRSMLKQTSCPVTLMCSSPPFAMGFAGRIMKALYGSKIIMALDMRDLWSLHTAFPGPKLQKRLVEKWVIGGADIFTTVAPSLASRFQERFGKTPTVVYNVATQAQPPATRRDGGFSWQEISPLLDDASPKIVYTGSIPAGFYDIDGFLDAIERFVATHKGAALQFVFVGAGGEIAARLQYRKIPPAMIVFVPQMDHASVAIIQEMADVLLFMGYKSDDNQGQVSIKLFEYFRRGKPILSPHIREFSDVDKLIKMYCGFNVVTLSTDSIADAFYKISQRDFDFLPISRNPTENDRKLLEAYNAISDSICARY